MKTREKILAAVRKNKPVQTGLPAINFHFDVNGNLLKQFRNSLTASGAESVLGSWRQFRKHYEDQRMIYPSICNQVTSLDKTDSSVAGKNAAELAAIEICYLEGEFGVAENGAIWVSGRNMSNRLLPFICQHLVLMVRADSLVGDMHEAYDMITTAREDYGGYGVFIAGPSKTADIEQSLVIGAHGPLRLTVWIVEAEKV